MIGLLLAATALAEMRTWTFQQSGKTIQGEVLSFAGDTVTMKLPDGKTFSVPIAYLTESNRVTLAAERAKLWKEVEVVRLEDLLSAGRYAKCTVKGRELNGVIVIQFLPESVEAILINRNQQAAQIANLSAKVSAGERAIQQGRAVIPLGTRDPAYEGQRVQVNQVDIDVITAKGDLEDMKKAYADSLNKTRAATIVKIKRSGVLYGREPVWECPDPRKPQQ